MANKRMFSLDIVDTDAFLDMPATSQLLYFHLAMRADDEGFVGGPKKVMRQAGCGNDDLKILITKRYLLSFDSGIVVIKHWLVHNTIRMDRFKETTYQEEKETLSLNTFGAYTDGDGIRKIEKKKKPEWQKKRQEEYKNSDLPYSFSYKITNAFYGKECPICSFDMIKHNEFDRQPSVQHNKRLSDGGKHEINNISVICLNCNISLQNQNTGELNNKEVIKVWNTIGTQSATQVKLSKVKLSKVKLSKVKLSEYTPAQEMNQFINSSEKQKEIIKFMVSKGIEENIVTNELKKFLSYWTEPTKSGKKTRWETERTFEIKRRLSTWFNNYNKFNNSAGKIVTI